MESKTDTYKGLQARELSLSFDILDRDAMVIGAWIIGDGRELRRRITVRGEAHNWVMILTASAGRTWFISL